MQPKRNTHYSNLVLKESHYKQIQRKILNVEQLSDKKIYIKTKFPTICNKQNPNKKEELRKFGEHLSVYNFHLTRT